MINASAYKIAAKNLQYIRQSQTPRALWIVGDDVARTPSTDWDIQQMEAMGATLVGVFTADRNVGVFAAENPVIDLAEAIITADMEAVRRHGL
jgi:predicted NAD-dependent protein-ADP-ribosyltransferase YbiA (DUF1768 family)